MVRRMLTVQDRAVIAKGLQEGCLLRRTADRIVWIGFRGISGDTPQRREGPSLYQKLCAEVRSPDPLQGVGLTVDEQVR